jgi:uncharacterized protein (TIGR02646 family)
MQQIIRKNLDKRTQTYLSRWQTEINNLSTYKDKVEQAATKYSSRRSTKTFKQVCDVLDLMCSGNRRCNYCEDSVADEVEHIKPKSLYPEFVFVWENYLYACGQCNTRKNNKYAVFINGALIDVTRLKNQPIINPLIGSEVFLNPRIENPMDYIELDLGVKLDGTFLYLPRYNLTSLEYQRAEYTIKILNLNRDYLLRGRAIASQNFKARLVEYEQKQGQFTQPEKQKFIESFREISYPSVWYEVKKQYLNIPSIKPFFVNFPEVLNW